MCSRFFNFAIIVVCALGHMMNSTISNCLKLLDVNQRSLCFKKTYANIRSQRLIEVQNAFDEIVRNFELSYYLEPEIRHQPLGYSYLYDQSFTENKNICVIGCFSLRFYLYLKLFSGAKRILFVNKLFSYPKACYNSQFYLNQEDLKHFDLFLIQLTSDNLFSRINLDKGNH